MTSRREEDLTERCFEFSKAVYDYCEDLVQFGGLPRRIGYQLFDAGSSVGANRTEAKSAYSDRDFASKNCLVLKECRESRFWLRLAEAKSQGNAAKRSRLLNEANQLVAIFIVVVRSLKDDER